MKKYEYSRLDPPFPYFIIIVTKFREEYIVDFFHVLSPLTVTHVEPALA